MSFLGAVFSVPAHAAESGVAVLPLRARGLTPAEFRRLQSRVATAFKDTRADVLGPEEIAARLGRDEKHRTALEEARRLSGEGQEKSRSLEHREALERYDRAIALYRDHFGEYADPEGLGEVYIRRAAERLSGGDQAGARSDFFSAVTFAPEIAPSLDDFPPPVVDGWEGARNERARRPLPPDDTQEIASLGASLAVSSLASIRAEKTDRPDDSVMVELTLWPAHGGTSKSSRAAITVDGGADALLASVREIAGPPRTAIARPLETPRADLVRDPARPPVRASRPPRSGTPLWRNPWVLGGAALLLAGAAGAGIAASSSQAKDPGYKVIVTPGS